MSVGGVDSLTVFFVAISTALNRMIPKKKRLKSIWANSKHKLPTHNRSSIFSTSYHPNKMIQTATSLQKNMRTQPPKGFWRKP